MASKVSVDEGRHSRDTDPGKITVQNVDLICVIMKIDPKERHMTNVLLCGPLETGNVQLKQMMPHG